MKITSVEDFFLIRAGNIFLSNKEKQNTVKLVKKNQSRFNWSYVLEHAEKNYIIPQLYFLIDSIKDKIDIPSAVCEFLEKLYYRTVSFDLAAQHTLKEVSTLFVRNNIEFLLVKGNAIARYYPKSSARYYIDIDFLIPSGMMIKKASKLLLKAGYNLYSVSQPKGDVFFHLHYTKPQRFSVELLRELQWGKYRAFISTSCLFSNAVEEPVNDQTVLHASPEDSIVIICARLLDTGFFLIRDLVDVWIILNELSGKLDWDYLLRRADEDGLTPALITLLYLANRINGHAVIPDRIFRKLRKKFFSKFLFSLLEKTELSLPLLEYSNLSRVILLFALLQKYKRDLHFFILRGYQSGFGKEIVKFLLKRIREPLGVGFLEKLF